MSRTTKDNRIPLSLRLPPSELKVIDEYALHNHVSKTDAFLHFLRKGIEVESSGNLQLKEVDKKIDTLLRIIEREPASLTHEDISEAVAEVACAYPAINKVYLFGSFARGQATVSSDIDLRIELTDDNTFSLFDLSRFKKDFEHIVNYDSDIITAHNLNDKRLAEAIEKEKVLLYERKEK